VLTLNHRFAPDRTAEEAFAHVRDVVGTPDGLASVEVGDSAAPAPPALDHPLLERLVAASGAPPRAKLGWTDVSFFAAHGIPATNFGPGEPTLAHTAAERVDRAQLDQVLATLRGLLS
jgi:succinyl-diaminopimelate desuccinylase